MLVHRYFESSTSKLKIVNFLNVCKLEPFEQKMECYVRSLKNIANNEEDMNSR